MWWRSALIYGRRESSLNSSLVWMRPEMSVNIPIKAAHRAAICSPKRLPWIAVSMRTLNVLSDHTHIERGVAYKKKQYLTLFNFILNILKGWSSLEIIL